MIDKYSKSPFDARSHHGWSPVDVHWTDILFEQEDVFIVVCHQRHWLNNKISLRNWIRIHFTSVHVLCHWSCSFWLWNCFCSSKILSVLSSFQCNSCVNTSLTSSFQWINRPTHARFFWDVLQFEFCSDLSDLSSSLMVIFIFRRTSMAVLTLGQSESLIQALSTCHWWFSMTLQVRYNMNYLSHLRCDSNLLTSRPLNTSCAIPLQHPAPLIRITSQIPNLYLDCILFMGSLEICFASTVSLRLGCILVTVSRHGFSATLSFRPDPLT